MLTSHLGLRSQLSRGGVADRNQHASGLQISYFPLPQFPAQSGGEKPGTGVCLPVLLLVGALIGSSWCAAPPPASAIHSPPSAQPPQLGMGPEKLCPQKVFSNVRRNCHSPTKVRELPPALSVPYSPAMAEQKLGTAGITAPMAPSSPLVPPTLALLI